MDNKATLGRRSDNDVLPVNGIGFIIGGLATMAFMGTNFIAWEFRFPTSTEQLLWRISSCTLVGLLFTAFLGVSILYNDRQIKTMQEEVRKRRKALEDLEASRDQAKSSQRLINGFRRLGMKLRNNSRDKDPFLDVSSAFVFVIVPSFAVYCICRLYILAEDFAAFRSLPADAYDTVDWWTFVPNIS